MIIHSLAASILTKGVSSLAAKALERLDHIGQNSEAAFQKESDLSLNAQELTRLLPIFQDRLSSRLQPPYLNGAIENNLQALEEESTELVAHLKAMGIPFDTGLAMEQLESTMPEFISSGVNLGNPYDGSMWRLLDSVDRSVLEEAHAMAKSGLRSMQGVHEMAMKMQHQYTV